MKQRSVTSKTGWSRLLAVSSGENNRKVPPPSGVVVAAYTSRMRRPAVMVFSTIHRPRVVASSAIS